MRDFGFWVRIVAISQLFSLVLVNFGDSRLSPDNPLLNLRERPPPPRPLSEIVAEARPAGAAAASAPGTMSDEKMLKVAGWGADREEPANWNDKETGPAGEFLSAQEQDPEELDWGKSSAE